MNAPTLQPQPAMAGTTAYANIVDGRRVPAADGRTLDAICPSDGAVFATMPRSGRADVDAAVAAARAAFETGPWGRHDRHRARPSARQARRGSSPITTNSRCWRAGHRQAARQGKADITAAARYFEFYGTAADKVHGETIPFLNGYTVAVVRDPHGVTGPYRAVELSGPDLRPLGRRLPRLRQRLRGEAGGGRLPLAHPHLRTGARGRLPAGRAQPRHRSRRGGGRGPLLPSRHRLHLLHRLPGSRHADPDGGGEEPYRLHAGARRQVAPGRVQGRRFRRGGAEPRQRDHPERGPDLLGRLAHAGGAPRL
jgi:hypothetical protein